MVTNTNKNTMNFKKWLKPTEVAEILGVSIYIVRRLCVDGDLTRININAEGGRPTHRIMGESVERLLNYYPNMIKK